MGLAEDLTFNELHELAGSLTCGLEIYEVLRDPRLVDQTDYATKETTLNESGLREEISCPICTGIIDKCVVIKTCLHRFCSSCIEKCFRVGVRECPKCRRKVPSRRFLRPDPIYDSIISRVVPNVKVFEELCDMFTMAINKGMKDNKSLEMIRGKFLNENPQVDISSLGSIENGINLGEFSVTSIFDDRVYIKEIRAKRKLIWDSMPKLDPDNKLWYSLHAENCQQIVPNMLHDFGMVTIHHLGMYIKTNANIPLNEHIYLYTKEPKHVATPCSTLASLRNISMALPHECVNVYYSTRRPCF
ncbi:bifunctional Zinc finger [Babesia duncani]|uniref:RING-type E3 ubiquitin transferase n=1 Tax=Babesia duncani TaxID=323732 RepID=A0AAD9PKC7_9APIC|nr:bifunctional Zinc finger [Babesia duncani]